MRKQDFAKLLIEHGATLWPTQFCNPFLSDPTRNWFELPSRIIATAQQIAESVGRFAQLTRPENYPDRYGRIQPRQLPQYVENIVPAVEIILNAAPVQAARSTRIATFIHNGYSIIRGSSRHNQTDAQTEIPTAWYLGEQRQEEVIDADIVDSMTPRITF